MKKLENSQQAIYAFINEYYAQHSYPPTVREICAAVGLSSTSTVHAHLAKLEQRGLIAHHPTRQRSIVITKDRHSAAQDVPLVGNVAAGLPMLATENIESIFPLPQSMLSGGNREEVFLLRVEGDSMMDIGMFSGDLILVHKGLACNDGDIVVARVSGETATVKRLFRERDHVRLQPENTAMSPILVPYEDVELVGRVIGLLRSY